MATKCKKFFLCLAMLLAVTAANAVEKPTKIYIYGFSASFNDSTIYLTDIMEVDSAWINTKNKFLYGRSSYSYQLKTYLQEQGVATPTCIVSYATSRKDAEKKYVKLKKKYTDSKGEGFIVKYIPATDFKFHSVSADSSNGLSAAERKAAEKAEKKALKEKRKQEKNANRPPMGPGAPEPRDRR